MIRRAGLLGVTVATVGWVGIAVSAAQGSEYGRCLKVHKGTGAYEDRNCTTPSPGEKGGYGWFPWGTGKQPQKGTYRAYTNGVRFVTSAGRLTCLGENPYGDSFNGEIASATGGHALVVLQECGSVGTAAEAGIFYYRECANSITPRGRPIPLIEFPVTTRLVAGLEPETEYVIEKPVTVPCYDGPSLEMRFSGSFAGPTVYIAGEMEHVSKTTLSREDLQIEFKQGNAPWEAPIPLELKDSFGIHAKYKEKLEING